MRYFSGIYKINKRQVFKTGSCVTVRINYKVILKHVQLYHQKKILVLNPYCSDYKSIILNEDEIEDPSLVGVGIMIVRGIYKRFNRINLISQLFLKQSNYPVLFFSVIFAITYKLRCFSYIFFFLNYVQTPHYYYT